MISISNQWSSPAKSLKVHSLSAEFHSIVVKTTSKAMRGLKMEALAHKSLHNVEPKLAIFATAYNALFSVLAKPRPTSPEPHTPPNRITTPANPNYSGDSGSSTESKGEHITQKFADRFIDASLTAVSDELGDISWLNEKDTPRLSIKCIQFRCITNTLVPKNESKSALVCRSSQQSMMAELFSPS